MANSAKTTTMKVSEEIYNRLTKIKNELGITYTEAIEKLIEKEKKENYVRQIIDYIFLTENNDYPFRIIYKKHENIVEFNVNGRYTSDKNDWVMSARDKALFSKFINKEKSYNLLENMGNSMEFNKFVILKM